MSSDSRSAKPPERAAKMLTALAAGALLTSFVQAADLAALQVIPERGQSPEQVRRDRYECHNWAVEQTGTVPQRHDPQAERAEARAERVDKVILGAAIGATIGGFLGGRKRRRHGDVADAMLGGAALGAAAGAVAGKAAAEETPDPDSDYLRALDACLAGRGYALVDAAGNPV